MNTATVSDHAAFIGTQPRPEQLLEQGLSFHRQGDHARAIDVYLDLLKQVPDLPDALHLLGEARYRQGRLEEALDYLNHAVARSPHHFYLNTRGMILLDLGYLQEAEQDLRRAIKAVPGYLEAHINLSNVYRKKGDLKRPILPRCRSAKEKT